MGVLPSSIANRGTRENYPDWLNTQIRRTNLIGIVLGIGIGFVFAVVSVLVYSDESMAKLLTMIVSTFVGFLFMTPIFLMNSMGRGWVDFTRYVFSFLTTGLTLWYTAQLQQSGSPHITAVWMLAISFFMTPLMLWNDRHERKKLVGVYLALAAIWFSYNFWYDFSWFEYAPGEGIDYHEFNAFGGWMFWASFILSLLNAAFYIWILKSNYGNSAKNI